MALEVEIDVVVKRTKDFLEAVRDFVAALLKILAWKRRHRATRIIVIDDQGEENMGKPLANTDTRRLFLVPQDDDAKKDSIQAGTMKATSLDESVATVALDPNDELQAIVTPVDGAESDEAKFEFTADADMGEGVVEIKGEYSCPIVDKMATVISVTEGEDTPKP